MICPKCGSNNIKVTDSRADATTVERRRVCSDCGARFFTIERIVDSIEDCPLLKANNRRGMNQIKKKENKEK